MSPSQDALAAEEEAAAALHQEVPHTETKTDAASIAERTAPEPAAVENLGVENMAGATQGDYELLDVEQAEVCLLGIVPTPRVGSCIYSCIALSKKGPEFVREWNCVPRRENGVALHGDREKLEEEAAAEVARLYSEDADPQHVPQPKEYDQIAKANGVSLDVHLHYEGKLCHFLVNPGSSTVVKVLYTTVGGQNLRDGSGHFDFLMDQTLDTEAAAR